ncbi:MAG: transcription elongation factor GreA [candidate division Zixibacteria bacterium]|nr:transcription elongation factor GreA [candidate division Zixibacteria bacterium]
MGNSNEVYVSEEGLEKMKAELHLFKYTKRPEIVAEIKRAMEMGDLSENAEYHAAKETQTHIERKIADLEFKLSRIKVIKRDEVAKGKAYLFAKVTIVDLDDDEEETYTLVSPEETDLENNCISIESPIGLGLRGKEVGDKVKIKVPAGTLKYKITKIE